MLKNELKRCVVLLIDGISSKKFESLLKNGVLPNIKALIKNGTYVPTCISTFPSVTGPAHVPIFMGKAPFHFGIAGHNQFDRNYRYFDNYLLHYERLNRRLAGAKSVFNHYQNSVALAELVYKGSQNFVRYISGLFAWLFGSDINTSRILKRIVKEYLNGKDLIVAWLGNSDAFQHMRKTDGKLIKLMKKVDRFVGTFANIKTGNTRIIICSDHGMERVRKRFRIKKAFRKMGLRTSRMKFNFDGGGFAQIYFRHPRKETFWRKKMSYKQFKNYIEKPTNFHEMMKKIAKSKAIEFLMVAKQKDTYVFSEEGVSAVSKNGNRYLYRVLEGRDPFGYSEDKTAKNLVGRWITKEDCLRFSHHTKYPDAIYQLHNLLQSENAGEMIVTSSKNITWNAITRYAVHGGLRREQMRTAFVMSDKIADAPKFMRTEKIFNYIASIEKQDKFS